MFYNTIDLKGSELQDALQKTEVNKERIYLLLKYLKGYYTPFQVQAQYNRLFKEIPITSVRRALTDLTNEGRLKKSDRMKVEKYGAKNHLWAAI